MHSSLAHDDSQVEVWPAFTDIMMNLALILVFYLFAQIVIESQTLAVMKEITRRQETLQRAVELAIPEGLRQDVRITSDGNLQRYTFADWVLFDSAQAELKPSGMELLAILGKVFADHATAFSRIQIEGHTDVHPLRPGAKFASNWELSSARATSVVRFFEDSCDLAPGLLSATGYSEHHPIDTANSDAARSRNRRIEVVVVYSAAAIQASAGGEEASSSEPATRSGHGG